MVLKSQIMSWNPSQCVGGGYKRLCAIGLAWRGLGETKGLLIIMRRLGKRLPRPSQSHSLLRDRELNVKGLPKSLSPGGPCTLGPSPQNKPTGSGHIMVAM